MDQLRQIETFVAVVQNGSFVKAAEKLGDSKAAVSRLVLELEARLDTRLLNRTTRKQSLTESGADYFERCRKILDDLAEANLAASASTARPVGRLRINAPVSFGNLHLAPLWGGFLQRHPDVTLDVTLSDRQVDLVEDGYDLAIRIARLLNSSLISRQLASTRLVLCASPAYLKLKRQARLSTIEDIAAHPVIAYSYWSGGDSWAFEGPEGPVEVLTQARLRSNSGDTCLAAALAGQGLILQPTFIVGADLKAGRLVEVLPHYRAPTLAIHAVYPSRQHLSVKVRRMVEYLAGAFKKPDWE
ncbi:LysR family transcriptional regulator [Polaromonas sp. JS666]|uniref:LysR family transcriptional regulator n=1 Tax=Polaromonas sp. (strain JS666 / ATCC BAA-500) TaxID=296591 RepID=UPI00004645B9|nr:LysR family transcriptional regulator [Polaromonas sp. JS666]ABE43792.1 transcriptional regulator, LysR family [Polaromonas sp. JS666]